MDAVEVDIELFITCRLCLNEKGTYQIIPSVQQQIKYCYDINIDTFDGLPQLVCKKCKDILNNYHATKTKYREIQDTLKDKLQKKPTTNVETSEEGEKTTRKTTEDTHSVPTEVVSSKEKKVNDLKIRKRKLVQRKKRIISLSSSSSENAEPSEDLNSVSQIEDKLEYKSQVEKVAPYAWEQNYTKYFVCHICKKEYEEECDIKIHMKSHENLLKRHCNMFETQCKVSMNNINETFNLTGLSTAVVHEDGLITRYLGGINYYIIYKKEEKQSTGCKRTLKTYSKSALDGQNDYTLRAKQKKCRLNSRSSTETVIIGNDDNTECVTDGFVDVFEDGIKLKENENLLNETPCIELDDSSNESSHINDKHPTNETVERGSLNYSTIREVILRTYNYVNNVTPHKRKKQIISSDSQLKRRVLSIGVKVITKQGFACTGLLRFLKEKKLLVKWEPRVMANIVHVRAILKETPVESNSWKNIGKSDWTIKHECHLQNAKDSDIVRTDAMTSKPKDSHVNDDKSMIIVADFVEKVNVATKTCSASNKLLNQNPVNNPKKLPKKIVDANTALKLEQKCLDHQKTTEMQDEAVCIDLIEDNANENLKSLPIITSINSSVSCDEPDELKTQNNNIDIMPQQDPVVNCSTDLPKENQPAPRIKVKPFSELMSNEALNSMNEPKQNAASENNLWRIYPQPQVNPVYQHQTPAMVNSNNPATLILIPQQQNVPRQQLANEHSNQPTSKNTTGYWVLNSPQMPKTITDSPFNYFRDLLRINNIFLMQTNATLSNAFKCIAVLKLKVSQYEVLKSLKLSLWCYRSYVCIKVLDDNNHPVDVTMLSIEWQWEILKVFTSDAVKRMYETSLKIGGDIYKNVFTFTKLLASIERIVM